MRDYIIKRSDAGDDPIIAQGESSFYINDEELIPKGFKLDIVHNRPKLKTIFVKEEEEKSWR